MLLWSNLSEKRQGKKKMQTVCLIYLREVICITVFFGLKQKVKGGIIE